MRPLARPVPLGRRPTDASAASPVDDDVSLDKADVRAADNYVQKTLDAQKVRRPGRPREHGAQRLIPPPLLQALPPVTWSTLLQNIQWVSFLALTGARSSLPFYRCSGSLTR